MLIVQPAGVPIPIMSDANGPEVTTLLLVSSKETWNVGIAVLIVALVEGRGAVKVRCGNAPGLTVIEALAVVTLLVVWSVAVKVQGDPVDSNATSLKVATPAFAETVSVPARAHADVSTIESVEPVPEVIVAPLESWTETANEARFVPVTAVPDGTVVNVT